MGLFKVSGVWVIRDMFWPDKTTSPGKNTSSSPQSDVLAGSVTCHAQSLLCVLVLVHD